ncbi:uncharacterized protein LOC143898783 [Temnothorax americanus]|uniref:uncharacterized protein LOC143898783 n=1 Tax=Temnothorax americanus TaxID=1964332 RepID=UPI0040690365
MGEINAECRAGLDAAGGGAVRINSPGCDLAGLRAVYAVIGVCTKTVRIRDLLSAYLDFQCQRMRDTKYGYVIQEILNWRNFLPLPFDRHHCARIIYCYVLYKRHKRTIDTECYTNSIQKHRLFRK